VDVQIELWVEAPSVTGCGEDVCPSGIGQ